MKHGVAVTLLSLVGAMASAQAAEIGAHKQPAQLPVANASSVTVDRNDNVVTVDRVFMNQPGKVSIKAANARGNVSSSSVLGQTALSPGSHKNVEITLDPERLQQNGYLQPGQEKRAFVTTNAETREGGDPRTAIKAIKLGGSSLTQN